MPRRAGAGAIDPGWDVAAQEADDVFLSLHEAESDLEFRAVDSDGTILWSAQRPRVCSGFPRQRLRRRAGGRAHGPAVRIERLA